MDEHNKLPHLATEQELLDAISKEEPAPTVSIQQPTFGNDIVSFLSFYEIQPGKDKVRFQMMYHLYRLWSKDPVSKETFGRHMARYIGGSRGGSYNINLNTLRLTE